MVEVTAIAPPTPVVGAVPLWRGLREKVDGLLAAMSTASHEGRHGGSTNARWAQRAPQAALERTRGCTGATGRVALASALPYDLFGALALSINRGVAAAALREIQGWVAPSGWRGHARLFPLPPRPGKVSSLCRHR